LNDDYLQEACKHFAELCYNRYISRNITEHQA